MEKKKLEAVLYSGVGIVVMFAIILAINAIGSAMKVRVDLTENNIYTLSEGTRRIVEKLDTPIEIRFYATRSESQMPVRFKNYARRVEDILDELKSLSGGNIEVIKYDPQPDSDAEDLANLDGIDGQALDTFGMNKIYLGLAVSMLDTKVSIPFLSPDREKLLEYDLARAISSVVNPEKKTVGVISSLPVMGQPMNPMMQQMGQQGSEPWIIIGELERDFEVRDLGASVEEIDADIDVLLVIHPKTLAEATEYAIDQYLMKGGHMLALLDPKALTDTPPPGGNPMQSAMQPGSNLEKLLPAWGLSFDSSQVVADMNYMAMVSGRGGSPQRQPAVLSLTKEAMNADDVVTGELDSLTFFFAGAFVGEPVEGLTRDILIKSSENAQLVQSFMAQMGGDQIIKDFKSDQKEYALALRLTGNFKTAFPGGKPGAAESEEESDSAESDSHLAEGTEPGVVVLVGDTDFVYDSFAARVGNIFGQRIVMPQGGNLTFAQSTVEQLTGDEDLITVRSRATMERPFTRVRDMQAEAQKRYQGKLEELETELRDTEKRINDLQSVKDNQSKMILSPEQQAELARFREAQVNVRKELKKVRRNLRKDIDALENRLKWINILLMPVLVAITGIVLATIKKKRTAAK